MRNYAANNRENMWFVSFWHSFYIPSFIYADFFFRIALKREDAVSREMTKKFADDKKMTKKEKDERFVLLNFVLIFKALVKTSILDLAASG